MFHIFGRCEMMEAEIMDYIISFWKDDPEMKKLYQYGDRVVLSPHTIPVSHQLFFCCLFVFCLFFIYFLSTAFFYILCFLSVSLFSLSFDSICYTLHLSNLKITSIIQ